MKGRATLPRILVVDDDAYIRNSLKAKLTEENYVVNLATNEKEVIKKSKLLVYNVALNRHLLERYDR
ncbi:MAG: hypothetical protein QXU99_07940 [Candidatus Bathyarchaeia archaeon]